jgi:hypothetical protein
MVLPGMFMQNAADFAGDQLANDPEQVVREVVHETGEMPCIC